jgi:hypothetical protein
MFSRPTKEIRKRIESLRAHLKDENPLLVDMIGSFQELDKVGHRLGLLGYDESFATRIPWWPMIAVLGTFSAGKSTFINQYLGTHLQRTGNQAVDDRFTVICYSSDKEVRTLPGVSLNSDPRFPFYHVSEEIDKVAEGEGGRINTYLQLKTCPAAGLRGKIFIDSPGFDADEQRSSILRISDHILDLSDLALLFFDARRPEPGAMQDTIEHLVKRTVQRSDANKVLFILNQFDVTAKEDNAEDVVSAWQRAVARGGITSGRFYTIYSEEAAVPIENEELRRRYQSKRDEDLNEIYHRISEVSVERSYRIVGALQNIADRIEQHIVPQLRLAMQRWYRRVITLDLIIIVPLIVLVVGLGYWMGYGDDVNGAAAGGGGNSWGAFILIAVLCVIGILAIHFWVRRVTARRIARELQEDQGPGNLARSFLKNTRAYMSIFRSNPAGWRAASRKRLDKVRKAADGFVQRLNDRYANPSGSGAIRAPAASAREVANETDSQAQPVRQASSG